MRGFDRPLVVLAALFLVACGGPAEEESPVLVVRGGTVVDGTGAEPVEDAAVVIRGGTVEAVGPAAEVEVPAGAREVDASGGWILPGYVDAHVHYSQTGWFDGRPDAADVREDFPYPGVVDRLKSEPEPFFEAYLCSGITATFDVGGYPWTRDLQARGEADPGAPHVSAAGALLSTVDFWLNLPDQRQFVYMASDSVVRRTVRSHARLGSGAVKVWFITPPQPPDSARAARLVRAAGETAREMGVPLIVHATGLWEAKEAVRAGARVLVHSVFDEPVDDEFLDVAVESGVIYVPTLTVTEGYRNSYLSKPPAELPYPTRCVDDATRTKLEEGLPEELRPEWASRPESELPPLEGLERGLANLGRVDSAGIAVATGTDAGNPGTLHGPSIYREMELMARAGMTPMEVIVASTRNGARAMGRGEDFGTLEPGKRGDLVVLDRNPLEDVRNLRGVRAVVKDGRVVRRPDR